MESAAVLSDLLRLLLSKQEPENITTQEHQFFLTAKSKTVNHMTIGGLGATTFVWIATRKLKPYQLCRLSLAAGAGAMTAYWSLKRSINLCVDCILETDGSRMQHELKKIVLQRFGTNPQRMRPFAKHFYREEVYRDSNHQYPTAVYRQRNVYVDDRRTFDGNNYGAPDAEAQTKIQWRSNDPKSSKSKQVQINPGMGMFGYGDPLDFLFGDSSENEEVRTDESGVGAKLHGRNLRKARRKQRMLRRHEEPLSLGQAQYLAG